MIETIWALVEPYVRIIFKQKIGEQESSWKRGKIGPFLKLYDDLLRIEEASKSMLSELESLARDETPLVRVVIRSKLEKLSHAFRAFIDSSRALQKFFSIYDDHLSVTLTGVRRKKARAWKDLQLWMAALPTNKDSDDKLRSLFAMQNQFLARNSL